MADSVLDNGAAARFARLAQTVREVIGIEVASGLVQPESDEHIET